MHDCKKLSANTRAHKEIRNSTDCSAFKHIPRIQFHLTISTALTTSHLSYCQSLSAGRLTSTYGVVSIQPSETSSILLNVLLTYLAELLYHYFLLCSLHSSYTAFLKVLWMYSVCSCFRAFELAFSLPIMLFLQIYAWLTPYPSFCPNAIFLMMPTLALVFPTPLTCSIFFHSM